MGVRGEIYSNRVILPNRTYFFNVKENRVGDLYLNIVESKNRDTGGFDRQSVILFADDLQDFLKGFDESLKVMEKAVRGKKRGGEGSGADGGAFAKREERTGHEEGDGREERARRGERTERGDRAGREDKSERKGKFDHGERAGRGGKAGYGERAGRSERAERSERGPRKFGFNNAEKGRKSSYGSDRGDRGHKSERGGERSGARGVERSGARSTSSGVRGAGGGARGAKNRSGERGPKKSRVVVKKREQ